MKLHFKVRAVEERLKSGWGVGQTERHDQVFKMPITSTERDFPFITRGNANQVVGAFEIQLGKDLGGAEALEGLCNRIAQPLPSSYI